VAELGQRLVQLALVWRGVFGVEVALEVIDHLEGTERIAVPEKPFGRGYFRASGKRLLMVEFLGE